MRASWWSLRIALGATAFLAGLDKFFNLLANWPAYLSPPVAALPISATSFMHVVGVIEMIVGAVILLGYTRLGSYVLSIWLIGLALNLASTGRYFDVAVRDAVMAVAAFTLAQLSEVEADVRASATANERSTRSHAVTA